MGKSQKYTEDQLLEGVVRYSEFNKKKVKATELAIWCRDNVDGLEEVRDYHFTRNIQVHSPKTGKLIERQKLCTQRINEINKSRNLRVSINSNLILKASNIDVVFELSKSVLRNLIVETREMFDTLLSKNYHLERENEVLRSINKNQKTSIEEVNIKVSDLQKSLKRLSKQVNYLMKEVDMENRIKTLEKMGIEDEAIDLNTYTENLQQTIEDVMNINKILLEQINNNTIFDEDSNSIEGHSEDVNDYYVEDVISGIDFD
ncbi:MAG: hypothetical protein CVV02_04895 [Firmicutes bacterium HGW-Firmicutes-7]|nr:MAG: hypothetical protein CVV02_04895 [Firmicutes bacterium HGW-Firmicutes-7]